MIDAVAAVADHLAQRRLEQGREVLGQVAGAVHGDAEPVPHAGVGAVGADQVVGPDDRLPARGALAEHDVDLAAVLVEGDQFGAEADLGVRGRPQGREQHGLQVVLGHAGDGGGLTAAACS
jgi:hypothetical protein